MQIRAAVIVPHVIFARAFLDKQSDKLDPLNKVGGDNAPKRRRPPFSEYRRENAHLVFLGESLNCRTSTLITTDHPANSLERYVLAVLVLDRSSQIIEVMV
jgi:hypothetical protein